MDIHIKGDLFIWDQLLLIPRYPELWQSCMSLRYGCQRLLGKTVLVLQTCPQWSMCKSVSPCLWGRGLKHSPPVLLLSAFGSYLVPFWVFLCCSACQENRVLLLVFPDSLSSTNPLVHPLVGLEVQVAFLLSFFSFLAGTLSVLLAAFISRHVEVRQCRPRLSRPH